MPSLTTNCRSKGAAIHGFTCCSISCAFSRGNSPNLDGSMLLTAAILIYLCVAAAMYVSNVRRPHSPTFSPAQHVDNCRTGALLWPIGALLIAAAFLIGRRIPEVS